MNKYILTKNPKRKRFIDAHYTDEGFVLGYDIDNDDFADILAKRKAEETLTHAEQDRLGYYLGAVVNMTFRKDRQVGSTKGCGYKYSQEEYCDEIFTWLMLHSLDKYDPTRLNAQGQPSKPFSFFTRAANFAVITYFSNKKKEKEKNAAIDAHVRYLNDYVTDTIHRTGYDLP